MISGVLRADGVAAWVGGAETGGVTTGDLPGGEDVEMSYSTPQ